MTTEMIKTFYGTHSRISACKESGPFKLEYVVYRDKVRYNGFSSLNKAISVAESLSRQT